MSYSNLLGPILKPLWNLTNIEFLFLDHNHLEGPISQFLILGNLKYLLLRNNNFDGRFECLSLNRSWTQLEILDFSSNFLTGPIPSNISGLQNLQWLYLSSNNFNGTIPSWIFSLPSLTVLDLSNNTFSRNIQEFKSKSLFAVTLMKNQLEGPIASTICNLKDLNVLNLRHNNLEGTIPQCLGEMNQNLWNLDLSNNRLSGTVNITFSIGNSFRVISLHGNNLTGKIPQSLINCKHLKLLDLGDQYDISLGPHNFELLLKNLTQLRELNLDYVDISSTIPLNFSSYFTTLQLSDTQLRGILPERVFHLSNLESLDLSSNPQLTVRFPTTKWNSSASLMMLYLGHVNITGRIPESFSHLASLHKLDMSHSNLSGPIPKPLWNLTNIESLYLYDNHLEGPIPQFPRFGKPRYLSLRNNNLDGGLEFLSFNRSWTQFENLEFSSNYLSGHIPSNVSGLQNLKRLDLSSNNLNGTIPSWIFSLPSLTELDLSNNTFSGKIQEFKSKTLDFVSLKQNKLERPIPKSLLNQQFLEALLLSQNNISGQIASAICNLKSLLLLD